MLKEFTRTDVKDWGLFQNAISDLCQKVKIMSRFRCWNLDSSGNIDEVEQILIL